MNSGCSKKVLEAIWTVAVAYENTFLSEISTLNTEEKKMNWIYMLLKSKFNLINILYLKPLEEN